MEDFVEKLDAGLLGNIDRALRAAGGPQMRIPVSRPTQMNMTIGDIASDPDTSLQLQVQYRKAISKAGFPRAFKLSTLDIKPDRPPPGMYDPYLTASKLGISKPDLNKYAVGSDEAAQGLDALQQLFNRFHKDAPARESLLQEKLDSIRQQEAQRMMDVDEEEQNRQSQTDSLSHEVSRGYARFIVPQPDASGKDAQGNTTLKTNAEIERTLVAAAEKGSTAVQLGEDGESLPVKMYDMDKEPTKAYMYGGTIVPVETLGPDESELQLDLKPGIEINGFIAREEVCRIFEHLRQHRLIQGATDSARMDPR